MVDHDPSEYEEIVRILGPAGRPAGFIAIHSTALGPAFGGCRMAAYESETEALTDALALAAAMTRKAAICDLPLGGGKAVVIGNPVQDKSEALLQTIAQAVEALQGRYVLADDVGIGLDDLAVMGRLTSHTAAATPNARTPLPITAHGVLAAIRAAVHHLHRRRDLSGLTIAVQGLGAVGAPLCRLLAAAGARLLIADIDTSRSGALADELGARIVRPGSIHRQAVEVFAPCALGGVLNAATVSEVRARIVCGGADNQLADWGAAAELARRGVLYIPDYLAAAGGVIGYHQETIDDRPDAVLGAVQKIGAITAEILDVARALGTTPLRVAACRVATKLDRHQSQRAA